VITALAQRSSGLFSHSAAQAVAQLKSQCAHNAFIATTAPRTQMICNSVLVEKTLLNSVMRSSALLSHIVSEPGGVGPSVGGLDESQA
jgi:hypothetical protein